MMDGIKDKIVRQLSYIKECTTDVDSVIDKLIETGVISIQERSTILSPPGIKDQIQNILDIVIKKKREDTFISALKETANDHVVDRIFDVQLQQCTKCQQFIGRMSEKPRENDSTQDVAIQVKLGDSKLEKESMNLKKEIDDLKEENVMTKNENKELKDHIEKLQNENQNLFEGNNHLKQVQGKVRTDSEKAREKVVKMNKDNIELRKALDIANEQRADPNLEELTAIREELCTLKREASYTENAIFVQKQEHEIDIEKMNGKLADFQSLFDQSFELIKQLKEENKNIVKEIAEIQSSKHDKSVQHIETQTDIPRDKMSPFGCNQNLLNSPRNNALQRNINISREQSIENTPTPRSLPGRRNMRLMKSQTDLSSRFNRKHFT